MSRGHVLVIDADEWLAKMLVQALGQRGFTADVVGEARGGFAKACSSLPDCIVCGLDLPDIDGLWVARRIRTEPDPVARIPFLFVSELPDTATRVQGLNVGADAYLERPVTNEEVAAQVDALVSMARRHRVESDDRPSSSIYSAAIRGDLAVFPLATMLMMIEMERRTGTLEVHSTNGRRVVMGISHGLFANTDVDGVSKPAIEALREVLSWQKGKFAFRPREIGSIPPPRGTMGALVLEALRLDDEQNALGIDVDMEPAPTSTI